MASLVSFESSLNIYLVGCDKKTKKSINRANSIKDYGANLKLGSLRLGARFLFVSSQGGRLNVFSCQKVETPQGSSYKMHHYSMNLPSKRLVREDMAESRKFIEGKYLKFIRSATEV
jgi:hypothetical protein